MAVSSLLIISYKSSYASRYKAGQLYTYIGEVCVSVNPYREMNIYGADQVSKYKGKRDRIANHLPCTTLD